MKTNLVPRPAFSARRTGVRVVPALPSLPWLGAPWAMPSHPGAYLLEGYRRHGPVFRVCLLGMDMVALIGPEANASGRRSRSPE